MRRAPLALLLLLMLCLAPAALHSQALTPTPDFTPQAGVLRVVIKPLTPFVIMTDDGPIGFSIDLWNAIALRLDMGTRFLLEGSIGAQLDSVTAGRAEVAITGITITARREERIDFSQPMFNGGLQIMTEPSGQLTFSDIVQVFLQSSIVQTVGVLIVVIFVAANVVWWVERRQNTDHFPRNYRQGLQEGVWWAAVTLATVGYGDKTPRTFLGRALAIVWMFIGIALVANFTAIITAGFTAAELRGTIAGIDDLYGRRVTTVANTAAATALDQLGIRYSTVDQIETAYAQLDAGEIDAIVYDAPVLAYFANREGRGRVQLIEPSFRQEYYGIAVASGSPLREQIDRALLALREDGTYDALYLRWFGQR